MITIWGRETGLCVKKVLWCCAEVGVDFNRIDAGKPFGKTDTDEYLKMNPNGTVPTLVDGDYVLWESHAEMRYLALQYGGGDIYPTTPREHGDVNRWMDWSSGLLWTDTVTLVNKLMRLPADQRDPEFISATARRLGDSWVMADEQFQTKLFICGSDFTLADITLGVLAQLWMNFESIERPQLAGFNRWYEQISARPGFQRYAMLPLAPS